MNPTQSRKDETTMLKTEELLAKRVFPYHLERYCAQVMEQTGLSAADAAVSARVLATTDSWGVHTHGTRQIRPLMKNLRDGRIDARAHPTILREGPAFAVVDGRHAMPPVTASFAMDTAMRKAKEAGIAYVGVTRSSHFGAAGYYATMALRHDMIGVAMTNTDPWMTVPGGKGPIMGTNPIAYAIPAGDERPVFLDIATSSVAVTKILAAKALGKTLPDKWLVDEHGVPTDNPSRYPEHGALLPMAGHKGYGLAVLVETLTAIVTGAAVLSGVKCWLFDIPDRADQGHAFVAINVGAMMTMATFKARMDAMIREIKGAPKTAGGRIYLPGEMEWERQDAANREGMRLPDYVLVNLIGLAEDTDTTADLVAIFR
jgi:ureidoglycolate dehydrogenase (NAD+)